MVPVPARWPRQLAPAAGPLGLTLHPPASGWSHGQAALPGHGEDGAISTRRLPDSSPSAAKAEPLPQSL